MRELPGKPGASPRESRRLRRLSEEEIDLWLSVAASVARRPGTLLPERRAKQPPPVPPESPSAVSARLPLPPPAKPALPPLAPLERKLRQKLSRGRTTADAALDLHGLRQDEALAALRRFLAGAQLDGCKVVLVVTGKGGRAASLGELGSTTGVLRRLVPFWLGMPDFRMVVLGFEEAARSHGGSGALYVRLRRRPA